MIGALTNASASEYGTDCLNARFFDAENSSLNNSFKLDFNLEKGYCDFIPMFPAHGLLADLTSGSELASSVRNTLSSAFYPLLSFYPTDPFIVAEESNSINSARGLRFFFSKGSVKRLVFDKLSDYKPIPYQNGYLLPMQGGFGREIASGIKVSPDESSNLLIAGQSGSGKTVTLLGLLNLATQYGDEGLMTVVDGKNDVLLRNFCRKHSKINYLAPDDQGNNFVAEVNKVLKKYENLVYRRARQLASGEKTLADFPYATLVIDESLSFLENANRVDRQNFISLQSKLVLLNRAEKCQLIVSSQNFTGGSDGNISTVARDNFPNVILLSKSLKRDGRFIYANEDLSSIVIPRDNITSKGIGVIQTNGGLVTPFLAPFFRSFD